MTGIQVKDNEAIVSIAEGLINPFEEGGFTKSGDVRWLWSTYTPYYNYEGKITKILYFAIDITENKKHQEELETKIKQLEEQIKSLKSAKSEHKNENNKPSDKKLNDK